MCHRLRVILKRNTDFTDDSRTEKVNDPVLEKRGIRLRVHEASYRLLFFWLLKKGLDMNFMLSIMILLFSFSRNYDNIPYEHK